MVTKYNGRQPQTKQGGTKPTGQQVQQQEQKIESRYSQQKAQGGTGHVGSSGGNS